MPAFKIFVTRKIPESGIKMLKEQGYQIKINPQDRVLSKKEIKKNVKGVDALLCLLTDKIDGEIMDAAGSNLKIIANYAVGFDNIDLEAAKKRKILVTNTPNVLTETVAEHAFSLILALARRIVEADKFTRAGKYKGWEPFMLLGTDVYNKTLGIIGLGRIGYAVAQRAVKGFGMKVVYSDVKRNEDFEKQFGGEYVSLEELLKKADFISVHVPLLPSTKHLIGEKQFKIMKKTAFLINTSRGPILDEKALARALVKKQIKGAAIDVFEFEPKPVPALLKLNNIILTPHIASATEETRAKMSEVAANNVIAALRGERPPNLAF